MDDVDQLYQDIILDHYKNPRNATELRDDEIMADEENPLCGDRVRLGCQIEAGRIVAIRHEVKGCAISQASASMMSEALQGLTVEEARQRIQAFVAAMRGEGELDPDWHPDLMALGGVRKFPLRVKCATLSWHGLSKALAEGSHD